MTTFSKILLAYEWNHYTTRWDWLYFFAGIPISFFFLSIETIHMYYISLYHIMISIGLCCFIMHAVFVTPCSAHINNINVQHSFTFYIQMDSSFIISVGVWLAEYIIVLQRILIFCKCMLWPSGKPIFLAGGHRAVVN